MNKLQTIMEFQENITKEAFYPEIQVMSPAMDDEVLYSEEMISPLDEQMSLVEYVEDQIATFIPGSETPLEKEKKEEKETNWASDRDVAKFHNYLVEAYPSGIPRHDGNSTVGCERALSYLKSLNREISEALRMDYDNCLDTGALEQYRIKIMNDMMILNDRLKFLKDKIRDSHKKTAAGEVDLESLPTSDEIQEALDSKFVVANDVDSLVKEATTPRLQVVVTPFERAIVGILINSVVSAGHPFEDVYEFLNKKYGFTPREELSVMQLAMDSGFHIFKDRGIIGRNRESQDDKTKQGVDFIKNYLA